MKFAIGVLLAGIMASHAADQVMDNRLIDAKEFGALVRISLKERESRRLTENRFIESLTESNTVILDARSADKYALRHVKGAVNLPFTDFTADTLAAVIPTKTTRVVIYCNNNFLGSPDAFASKAPPASLNLSTYTSLKAYGYENIYELGPLVDLRKTAIPFEGSEVRE